MKVIVAVHHFLPKYYAGAELIAYRQARWLLHHGVDVEVVSIEAIDRGKPGVIEAWDEPYQDIPVKRVAFNLVDAEDPWRLSYANPWLGEWFADYVREKQPDIVHFHSGYLMGAAPMKACVEAGVPVALTLHDYWFFCPQITLLKGNGSICPEVPTDPVDCAWCLRLRSRFYSIPEEYSQGLAGKVFKKLAPNRERQHIQDRRDTLFSMLSAASAVITPSLFVNDLAKPHVNPEHLYFSRYGLDMIPESRPEPRKAGLPFRIGYIGQIAPHKGVHLLVEAFRTLHSADRQLELHIYGGLNQQPEFVQKLERMAQGDDRVQFLGKFDNAQVSQILADFDVLVVPSVWHEIGPLTIMEAFAAGTPVVCSPIGNMRDIVQNGVNGLHFATGDAVDLAKQLQSMLDEPDLVEKLRAGIKLPRVLDDEMEQLLGIYRKMALVHSAA